ncbi:hypothetical protein, partial [Pseudomonas syringae group genomosp. 7]|uniref:hypothetical protein n=1 Tax=Pseudomonas syringae group genomosp. 7 TaxID=251699 RepID=UPI00376F5AA5
GLCVGGLVGVVGVGPGLGSRVRGFWFVVGFFVCGLCFVFCVGWVVVLLGGFGLVWVCVVRVMGGVDGGGVGVGGVVCVFVFCRIWPSGVAWLSVVVLVFVVVW